MILDYVQRFTVGTDAKDQRERIETAVTVLRRFCDAGAAVFCAAAVARQKTVHGSSYRGLNLASFRGSSELEYGCDSAYLLIPEGDWGEVRFQCEKQRYGSVEDICTVFDPRVQSFAEAPEVSPIDRFDAVKPAPADRKRAKGD
jgi:replicative DNA helicase